MFAKLNIFPYRKQEKINTLKLDTSVEVEMLLISEQSVSVCS